MVAQPETQAPEPGQFVIVRRRPALIRTSHASEAGPDRPVLHFVEVEYIDGWTHPEMDHLIWEREPGTKIISTIELPNVAKGDADSPDQFHAFIDALRWSTVSRISTTGSEDRIVSPWQSAIQIEDYQLFPVFKAMAMPRVNLLLADDVGIGKTIEAGLIMTELIAQRRIRRVLIVCPASLQIQWQEEMRDKFNLTFSIFDSKQVFEIQRELGSDSNPWYTTPRIITSLDYLKQVDILDRFIEGSKKFQAEQPAGLPWDLLIVDEAHNCSPISLNDESQRYRMLQRITRQFEHRLFLTATPHNGFTTSFTGLLELLDPLRFQQRPELDSNDRDHINLVMVRRLKSEINDQKLTPVFTDRTVTSIDLELDVLEVKLFNALRAYRKNALDLLKTEGSREYHLGQFIFTLLTKRLLSGSHAFEKTWRRHLEGYESAGIQFIDAIVSRERAETETSEDLVKAEREETAARHGASWLRAHAKELESSIKNVTQALVNLLGWKLGKGSNLEKITKFKADTKFEALLAWIEQSLGTPDQIRSDERVIIFTEYKDTLDYLLHRFELAGYGEFMDTLYGGADPRDRRRVSERFNDATSNLRILVATDAASEGLNLQTSCRYVIHYEIPWNPMRLEQRNGRVDRYGQTRDVTVHHFRSDDEQDMAFLDKVARKVETVREDLGNVGQVLDEAIQQNLREGNVTWGEVEDKIDSLQSENSVEEETRTRDRGSREEYQRAFQRFEAAEAELGLKPERLKRLLEVAVGFEGGKLREEADAYRFEVIPPTWEPMVEATLRIRSGTQSGSMPRLAFDVASLEVEEGDRRVFRSRQDTVLLRLGHPLMARAIRRLRRELWEFDDPKLHRWTIAQADLPRSTEAIVVIWVITNVRNQLGEIAHADVLAIPFELSGRGLIPLEDSLWAQIRDLDREKLTENEFKNWRKKIAPVWGSSGEIIRKTLEALQSDIEASSAQSFSKALEAQIEDVNDRFGSRIDELGESLKKNERNIGTLRKAEKKAEARRKQRTLYGGLLPGAEIESDKARKKREEAEWVRRENTVKELREYLEMDRERIIERLLPHRYSIKAVDVQPAAVEILVRR